MNTMGISGTSLNTTTTTTTGTVQAGHRQKVPLEGKLGLRDAKSIAAALGEAIAASDFIEVDLGGVTGIDISIAQLLVAGRKSAIARGKTLCLMNGHGGAVGAFLINSGLVGPDGAARTSEEQFWIGDINPQRHAA